MRVDEEVFRTLVRRPSQVSQSQASSVNSIATSTAQGSSAPWEISLTLAFLSSAALLDFFFFVPVFSHSCSVGMCLEAVEP